MPCYIESPLNSLNDSDHPKANMRFIATTVLAATLLFSQGGNFLVAALCPHLRSATAACEIPRAETTSHEDMGHMGIDHSSALNPGPTAVAAGHGNGPCSHCAVHSSKNPNPASLRQTEVPKRSAELNLALHISPIAPLVVGPAPVLNSRAHGPPGESTTRHILINVFRI